MSDMPKGFDFREWDWAEDWMVGAGTYFNQCADCNKVFLGHKSRAVCKVCSDAIEMNIGELLRGLDRPT